MMATGRNKAMWPHTAAILAMLANINRDPKKTRAVKPSDFDPYADKVETKPQETATLGTIRGRFSGMPSVTIPAASVRVAPRT